MKLARVGIVVGAVAALALVARGGGEEPYRIRLKLPNAAGLRDRSAVVIGGIQAGKVELSLDKYRNVIAELRLERRYAPVGKDARATISAVNLLGIKNVVLDPGDRSDPAPDGVTLPARRVKTGTDLDQVLAVLDGDTRTRLAILMSEAGAGFAGRRADVAKLLRELPPSVADADRLLSRLVSDNQTLARLVSDGERFVRPLARHRAQLDRLIDTTGRAGAVIANRRADLRAALARTPGTLAQLRHFLARLRATTTPLGPAARDLRASAQPLTATLDQAQPVWEAAQPALAEARAATPSILRLADRATPVLRGAVPMASALAQTSASAAPVSETLRQSSDNILAVIDNWSKAVQLRDGLSHIFRGQASYSPEAVRSMIRVLQQGSARRGRRHHELQRELTDALPRPVRDAVEQAPPKVVKKVQEAAGGLLPKLPSVPPPPVDAPAVPQGRGAEQALDYLLGS